MNPSVQSVIMTADLERLRQFYASLFGARETMRVPETGPLFFLGLRIGESPLGLVSDPKVEGNGPAGRLLLSIDVDSPDHLLVEVEPLGGRVLGPPTDMPWGQRVAHIEDPDGNLINLTRPL